MDLALKAGVDQYRFVAFDVDSYGKIVLNSNNYVAVSKRLENEANEFLRQRKEIVKNSFLPDTQKRKILCG